MIRSVRGGLAAAFLCALLSACGGGGDSGGSVDKPTQLPAAVDIQVDARAETGASVPFRTSLADTSGVTFLWDFGDGTTGSGATPTHAYANPGAYTVTVSVANTAEDLRLATYTVQVGRFSNVAGLDCTSGDGAGWCWQNVNVTPHVIDDVYFVPGTSIGWAVGHAGTLLNSTDGGDTWHAVPTGITDEIMSVRFRDASHGLALTYAQYGLQTADGGKTWTPIPIPLVPNGSVLQVVAYDASQIVISSQAGVTAVSHDDGLTWTTFNAGYYNLLVEGSDCWTVDSSNVSVRAGCTAAPVNMLPLPNSNGYVYFVAGAFATPQRGIVLCQYWDSTTYQYQLQTSLTNDAGMTWSTATKADMPCCSIAADSVQMIDANHAFFDSYYGPYATADAGQTWSPLALAADMASSGSQVRTRVLAGTGIVWSASPTQLARTTDLGASWQVIPGPEAATPYGPPMRVLSWNDAQTVIVLSSDRLYVTHDAGTHWKRTLGNDTPADYANSAALWFTDSKHGVLAQGNGTLRTTADGGLTWTRQDYPTGNTYGSVALQFTSATEGWLVLNSQLAHTIDGGASWNRPLLPSALSAVYDMSWGDASHGWAVGWNNSTYALYSSADAGRSWAPVTPIANDQSGVWAVRFEDASTGIALGGAGILRTTDGGASWKVVGARPPGDTLRHTGAHTFWILGGGFVTRSTDSGATWTRLDLPYNDTYVDITGSDDRHAWLVRDPSSVLATDDGGTTWTQLPVDPDVRVSALFALDNETVWGATDYGLVFASATGGR
jgi:photosystem II stability/assembly factor-like uncharacterized protein